jgi:hypothetical protein
MIQIRSDLRFYVAIPNTYRIPTECVEFINAASPAIIKSYAFPLRICIDESEGFSPLIPVSWWRLDDLNFPDWIMFMDEGELSASNFYMNCNPDSKRYGQILFTNDVGEWNEFLQTQPTIFRNIHHLVENIELWIQHVKISDTLAIRDMCVQHFLDSKCDRDSEYDRDKKIPEGSTNRQILENSRNENSRNENSRNENSRNGNSEITTEDVADLMDDIVDTLIYPDSVDVYPYDDTAGTYGSISSWLWEGLHLH